MFISQLNKLKYIDENKVVISEKIAKWEIKLNYNTFWTFIHYNMKWTQTIINSTNCEIKNN